MAFFPDFLNQRNSVITDRNGDCISNCQLQMQHINVVFLTCVGQSLSREVNGSSATWAIYRILWNSEVHYTALKRTRHQSASWRTLRIE